MRRLIQERKMAYLDGMFGRAYKKLERVALENSFSEKRYQLVKNSMTVFGQRYNVEEMTRTYEKYKKRLFDFYELNAKVKKYANVEQIVEAMEMLEQLETEYEYLDGLEKALRASCVRHWRAHLTIPQELSKDEYYNKFAFLTRACGIASFQQSYPIVSTSLFTDSNQTLYREQKMALIYPLNESNLVAMAPHDMNSGICSIDADFRMLIERYYRVDDDFLHVDFWGDSLFYNFNDMKEAQGLTEVILKNTCYPTGVLIMEDASESIRKVARSYATVFGLPLIEYRKGHNVIHLLSN